MTGCLDRAALARFVAGTASRCERRLIVRHLLAGCRPCAGRLHSVLRPPVEEGAYDGALARVAAWARVFELAEVGAP